jgi:hypothetical protein
MSNAPNNAALNSVFMAHLNNLEGKEKLAAVAQTYIRDKLRENSFARKLIPPQQVSRTDLQVSVHHDTMVFVDEIEPNSRAMSMTFRGSPTARYIRASRYEIPMFTISSERFEKTEQELMSYKMAITKVIEDNSVKDIQEIEDHRFLIYCEAACQATEQIVKGEQATDDEDENGSDTGFRGSLQRPDLVKLFQELDGSRRRLERVLMNETDWDSVLTWSIEDFGDKQANVTFDGLSTDKLMGRMIIRTIKTDILQAGNIYGFCSPEWLGKFLVLNNTKFYIDKVANLISWQSWEDIGIGLGNVASLAKLELYNDASDDIIAESEVGTQVYNQADDGITFPAVHSI